MKGACIYKKERFRGAERNAIPLARRFTFLGQDFFSSFTVVGKGRGAGDDAAAACTRSMVICAARRYITSRARYRTGSIASVIYMYTCAARIYPEDQVRPRRDLRARKIQYPSPAIYTVPAEFLCDVAQFDGKFMALAWHSL